MSKHTPEPWFDDRATHDELYQNIKILGDENRGICWLWIDDAPVDDWNSEQRANANRIVTCVNACAGMANPAAEIAEMKRQRDELLGLVKAIVYHSVPVTVSGTRCAAFPWSEYESMVKKAKGSAS